MNDNEIFICLNDNCKLGRIIHEWEDIIPHEEASHKVLTKDELYEEINKKITKLKSSLFSDLLAKINKIIHNTEENLNNQIRSKFNEIYKTWEEKLNLNHMIPFLLPSEIDPETPLKKLMEIYSSLSNEQLHYFKDCLISCEELFTNISSSLKQQFLKVDSQLKQITTNLYNLIANIKQEREQKDLKQGLLKQEQNRQQELKYQNDYQDTREVNKRFVQPINRNEKEDDYLLKNNTLKYEPSQQRWNQRLAYNQQQSQQFGFIQKDRQLGSTSQQKYGNYQQQRAESIPPMDQGQRPLKGYKEFQQQVQEEESSLSVEKYYKKKPHSTREIQDEERVSEIIYEKAISPPKVQQQIPYERTESPNRVPPPLRGYKDRQNIVPKPIKLQRSNDKRQYLDEQQILDLASQTLKRFDIDKSDKHMKYSDKFGTILCPQQCFAIVEGVFSLSQSKQIQILLTSVGMNYEIAVGIVNLTQIKQKNTFPDIYGINKQGESLSTQMITPIRLLPDRPYLLAYRQDQHILIIYDSENNIQQPMQLPLDQSSEFVFFVRMSNLKVSLI